MWEPIETHVYACELVEIQCRSVEKPKELIYRMLHTQFLNVREFVRFAVFSFFSGPITNYEQSDTRKLKFLNLPLLAPFNNFNSVKILTSRAWVSSRFRIRDETVSSSPLTVRRGELWASRLQILWVHFLAPELQYSVQLQ